MKEHFRSTLAACSKHLIMIACSLGVDVDVQYPMAIEMLQEGRIDVKPMITHRFGFSGREEVIAGFECAADAARTKAIKVMFNLSGEA